jgi:hypothetical protein
MTTAQTRLFSAFILVLFLGCSTASVRVMPNVDGTISTVARDTSKEGAEEAVVKNAQKYCSKNDQEAVFIGNETKYTGTMDESTRDTIKHASTAAWMIGGMNSPVQDAGTAGYAMTSGKDYESTVTFRCR